MDEYENKDEFVDIDINEIAGDEINELHNNPKEVIYHELKAINNYTYSNFKRTIKKHFDWAYKILDELLNSQYLSQIQKDKVELIKNDVKDNENKYKNKKIL